MTSRRIPASLLLLLVVACTVACDRATKHYAAQQLAGLPTQSFIGDTVRLDYVENPGGFLSVGAELPPRVRGMVFSLTNVVVLFAALAIAARHRPNVPALVGAGLLFAGGLSNLIDRWTRGSVIDFLNVGIGWLRTGIFNVADVAILGGACLLLFALPVASKSIAPTR